VELIAPGVRHFIDSRYCLGADLGQQNDFTALCVIEARRHSHVTVKGLILKEWDEYLVRHMERVPLHTDYVQVVTHIRQVYMRPPLDGTCDLIIDDGGVGRAVGDLALAAGLRPTRVTITGGDAQTQKDGRRWNVSKGILISILDAALHSQKLKISPAVLEATAFREELVDFRRSVTAAGRFTYEARVGRNDDLILACAITIWNFVGRPKPPVAQVGRYGHASPLKLNH
jgi:hypothetical protein